MVTTSGFSHTPISRALILLCVSSSIAISVFDIKHLIPLKFNPHLWPYLQFTRLLTFQAAYTNATEVLFATVLLYQLRVLERLWGSRKYASFLAVCFALNAFLVPAVGLVLKLFTLGRWDYVPAGLTGVVFAALSVWGDEVPRLYRYKILTGGASSGQDVPGLALSDKSTTYVLAAQLALSQFPYQLVPAGVGWVVGSAWIGELLPSGMARWRVPAWMVGESSKAKERGQYEGLRRRLEEEGSAADGMRNVSDQRAGAEESSRRGFGRQILGYFTGS